MAIHAIVGLGNPGRRYARTRHNAGFLVADELAARLAARWKASARLHAHIARGSYAGRTLILAKPQTFMNDSGDAVAGVARRWRVAPEELLVVYDDVSLALGRIRLRPDGGAGGHNGMRSTIERLGTDAFHRLRIGIAGPHARPGEDLADYVLSPFAKDELATVGDVVGRAADAAMLWLGKGMEAAMNAYNASADSG